MASSAHGAAATPAPLERVERGVRGHGRAPRADRVVELVVRGLATRGVGEPFVLREVGASEHARERPPRVVVRDGEAEPTLVGAEVHALRRAMCVTIAEPLWLRAELHVHEHVAELGQHVLALRELDHLTPTGRGAVVEGGEGRERTGGTGDAVHVLG